jgi:hypothetical protein
MQLVRLMWQPDHPAIPQCEVDEWLACIHDDAKDTPFNRLRETMRLACTVLGDGPDIPSVATLALARDQDKGVASVRAYK